MSAGERIAQRQLRWQVAQVRTHGIKLNSLPDSWLASE
jgi:hypothetical protein